MLTETKRHGNRAQVGDRRGNGEAARCEVELLCR